MLLVNLNWNTFTIVPNRYFSFYLIDVNFYQIHSVISLKVICRINKNLIYLFNEIRINTYQKFCKDLVHNLLHEVRSLEFNYYKHRVIVCRIEHFQYKCLVWSECARVMSFFNICLQLYAFAYSSLNFKLLL